MGTAWISVRTVVWVTLFLGGWYWLAQQVRRFDPAGGAPMPAWAPALGLLVMVVCGALTAWCVVSFVARGLGTPFPADAPRRLVIRGPYQYTRNPMYVGGLGLLCGLALVQRSFAMIVLAGVALLLFTLFLRLYEEPALRAAFDGEYDDYCRDVPRWLPRLRGTAPRR